MTVNESDEGFVDPQLNHWLLILVGIGVVVAVFVFNDVIRSINDGGIFSVTTAIGSMEARKSPVDVDHSGLQILFMSASSAAGTGLAVWARLVLNKWKVYFVILSIALGGIALDKIADERLFTVIATSEGYIRCQVGDHIRGDGKGKVQLNEYVRRVVECRAA